VRARQLEIVLASLALLALPMTSARADKDGPREFTVVERQTLGPGLEYLRLRSSTPQVVHVAHLSPGSPARLMVVESNGRISQSRSALERPDEMCKRVQCQVAVNGDFITSKGQPYGAVVTGGVLLRSPAGGRPQVWKGVDGGIGVGGLGFAGRVEGRNLAGFAVGGVNVDRLKDSITVYTPAYGAKTPSGSDVVELVARAADPGQIGRLGAVASLSLSSIGAEKGGTKLAPGTVVISAVGKGRAAVKAFWDSREKIGSTATLRLSTTPAVSETIGVNPIVLRNGQRAFPTKGSFITAREPRTLLAWNGAGDMWFIAVDGRQPSSKGWSMAEAAEFAASLGATQVVNFDGGGGTTFVVRGKVVNSPSDGAKGKTPGTVRRAVNALTVVDP
jgi:exopolysaccharide biosynthesis protein